MERRYTSPLRQQQQEMTRNRIMEALVALITEGRIADFTVRDVADKAGVSYGSVYRYYPTREALLDGLDPWSQQFTQHTPMPDRLEEVPQAMRAALAGFESRAEEAVAVHSALTALNMRTQGSRTRDERLRNLIAAAVPELSEAEQRKASAILRHIGGVAGWMAMRQRFGLSAEETAEALGWATEVLIRDLKQRASKEETT